MLDKILGIIACVILIIVGNGILYKYKDDLAAGFEDLAGIMAIFGGIVGIIVILAGGGF